MSCMCTAGGPILRATSRVGLHKQQQCMAPEPHMCGLGALPLHANSRVQRDIHTCRHTWHAPRLEPVQHVNACIHASPCRVASCCGYRWRQLPILTAALPTFTAHPYAWITCSRASGNGTRSPPHACCGRCGFLQLSIARCFRQRSFTTPIRAYSGPVACTHTVHAFGAR